MPILKFPPVDQADENGLLGVGGDLAIESLISAYSQGIFPWPISIDFPLAWFSPDPRGVLYTDKFRVNKSFKKFLNQTDYRVTFNQDFETIIQKCSDLKYRKGQTDTWITTEMIEAYIELHQRGLAFSMEVYYGEELSGGLYGVSFGSFVAGESMYHEKDYASKIALLKLLERCEERGIKWIDTQMVTPAVAQLGGEEIPRGEFMKLLGEALNSSSHLLY
jgi:leucyl/phenylalanyl-tRNA---protein transferase